MAGAQQRRTPINPNASGSSFVALGEVDVPHRLIMAIDGLEKQGKTHFALTAPGPIGILNYDIGLEGVVEKFVKGFTTASGIDIPPREIHVAGSTGRGSNRHYELPKSGRNADPKQAAEAALLVWEQRMKDYAFCLANFRSCLVDTASEDWDLLRLARFGKLEQVMPHHYTVVNSEYRTMLRMAYDQDKCNLILLHKRKPEYVTTVNAAGKEVSNRTGNTERAGFKDMGYLVQVNATAFRDDDGFQLSITDCRQNGTLNNEIVPEPLLSFANVATMIFPETQMSDWE